MPVGSGSRRGARGFAGDPACALPALEALGIVRSRGDAVSPPCRAAPGRFEGRRGGVLVAEGAHALHLMPEASLEDRLFVGCVARPVSIGKVWSFEVERDTVRRAFAAGFSAGGDEVPPRVDVRDGLSSELRLFPVRMGGGVPLPSPLPRLSRSWPTRGSGR